jgi:IS5 family transposase
MSKPKTPNADQSSFLYPDLLDQLDPKHLLLQLARKIDWSIFEAEFSPLYSHRGKPSKRIRLMVGLSILKHMENLSDEVLIQRWVQNPYYQVFTGEVEFQWQFPCDPSDMTYFRKRIGSEGFEKILAVSIGIHQEKIREDEMCIDTTVQEKNITFPTDAKQYRKIHGHLLKIARKENIGLSRTYEKEVKKLKLHTRFSNHPKNRKKARHAVRRLKTISGRLQREIQRRMRAEQCAQYAEKMGLYQCMLKQKRGDKNKLYSLHESHVYCMSKGKAHQRYEFGTKASITTTRDSGIVIGALAFEKNIFDGHTVVVFDDDNFYMGAVIAEKLKLDGNEVTLVTTAPEVSPWTHNTLEQQRIQARVRGLEIKVITAHNITRVGTDEVEVSCVYTEKPGVVAASSVVMVTSRQPDNQLYLGLTEDSERFAESEIASVIAIGDCLCPSTIASAVYEGHRVAREMDAPPQDPDMPFRREQISLEGFEKQDISQ